MLTLSDQITAFNKSLNFRDSLPSGIRIMNPFKDDPAILAVSSSFYEKYYQDCQPRHMILGINPGRFGAGVTGIPFTDTKRLKNECKIPYSGPETYEPSSVFVYEVIAAYGGTNRFYKDFYINSVCPLGFTNIDAETGKEKNYNYYDSPELTKVMLPFIVQSIRAQIEFGMHRDVAYCFGTGKNEKFLQSLNIQYGFFGKIIALEHPRFVMQYKSKSKLFYIDKYLQAFTLRSVKDE